jgi:predicted NBD/HSP70 family sugar kinase
VRKFSGKNNSSIEAVGVSLPGLVDPMAGFAIYVPYFNWRNLAVEETISSATELPVMIDNDASAVALAELWFGRPEVTDARHFIMVLVAEGVGTGIISDGQIYRGARGAAGEFGHMIVGTEAPVACSCGNYDCWEAFASERAALARYARLCSERAVEPSIDFVGLVDLALAGEQNARTALLETAHSSG